MRHVSTEMEQGALCKRTHICSGMRDGETSMSTRERQEHFLNRLRKVKAELRKKKKKKLLSAWFLFIIVCLFVSYYCHKFSGIKKYTHKLIIL